MRVLALDLGTKTGWAHWDGSRLESGVQDFALKRGESPGMRFLRFNTWLKEIRFVDQKEIDLIAYEAPHHRGGAATEIACGFSTRIHEFCARYEIEYSSVHTSLLKKLTTGKGTCSKEDMIVAAINRWNLPTPPADDNEADALCVLSWALDEYDKYDKEPECQPV